VVVDALSGREVIFAAGRAKRPGSSGALISPAELGEVDTCPVLRGARERDAAGAFRPGRKPRASADSPGWQVRVVPNLYPAFERQQVVIHSPAHARSLGELSDGQLALIVEAWAKIAEEAWSEGFDHLFVFVNEATPPAPAFPTLTPRRSGSSGNRRKIVAEVSRLRREGCELCALLADLRPIFSSPSASSMRAPSTSRSPDRAAPYELLIAPSEHLGDAFGETSNSRPRLRSRPMESGACMPSRDRLR